MSVCREEEDLDAKADIKSEAGSSGQNIISESQTANDEPVLKLENDPDRNLQCQQVRFFYRKIFLLRTAENIWTWSKINWMKEID